MLMKSPPILNKRIQNKITAIARAFLLSVLATKHFLVVLVILAGQLPILKHISSRIVLNYRYYYLVHYCHNCQLRVLLC